MDDGETVAATTAGDPSGLAAAYDTYAAPLYGYCRWMLRDPGQAADALRETFTVAAGKLDGKEAGQLRAWLYATARDDCYRRLRTAEPGFDEGTGEDAGPDAHTEQAVVRRVLREFLAELKPEEHEVIELTVRHGLDESELATVLEVSWSRAHTLASQAREQLELSLDALLIARTGRQSCPELGAMLAGWDGKLTVQTGKLAAQHIERCQICASRRHGSLRPEVLARLLPLPALPPGLREPILERAATRSVTKALKAAEPGTGRDRPAPAGPGRVRGIFAWDKIRANPGTATAAAAVALWVVAALSATLLTVTGLHATGILADPSRNTGATAATTPAASGDAQSSTSPDRSRGSRPSTPATPAALLPSFGPTPTGKPSKSAMPKPSASASATASASPSASPTDTDTSTPTPTPTRVHNPPTQTPTPTPTPTDTGTPTPTPT
jgi:RNA polymerase sigma factor (sigma-70 family)